MASFRIERPDLFTNGSVVKAYPASMFHGDSGEPGGHPVAEAPVSGGVAELTGLTQGVEYIAWAQYFGIDRYLRFEIDVAAVVPALIAGGAIQLLNSPTYGPAIGFGNVPGSFTFSGSGSPADIYAPLVMYEKYGVNDGANAPVTKTTQAWFSAAAYYGPTSDDSMECGSCFVAAKDTGTGYTQTRAITAFEGHAQVEGANKATNNLIGVASRISLTGTATSTSAFGFRASTPEKAAGATISEYVAFGDAGAVGPATLNFGVKVHDTILSESAIVVGTGSSFQATTAGTGGGSPAFVQVQNPASTNFTTIKAIAITGQTAPVYSMFDTGGEQRWSVTKSGSMIVNGQPIVAQQSGTNVVVLSNTGYVQPGVTTAAGGASNVVGAKIYSGIGVPALVGVVGDIYIRTEGGVGSTVYRCTVAGAAGAATWTAIL